MKRIISLVLIVLMLFSLPFTVSAAKLDGAAMTTIVEKDNEIMEQEVTEWFFRVHNNRLQKRLWSITFGYWKTGWITIA
jgi:uncharacterized membrane protein YccF (DUF307 family)